jgi:hypothetical protein
MTEEVAGQLCRPATLTSPPRESRWRAWEAPARTGGVENTCTLSYNGRIRETL